MGFFGDRFLRSRRLFFSDLFLLRIISLEPFASEKLQGRGLVSPASMRGQVFHSLPKVFEFLVHLEDELRFDFLPAKFRELRVDFTSGAVFHRPEEFEFFGPGFGVSAGFLAGTLRLPRPLPKMRLYFRNARNRKRPRFDRGFQFGEFLQGPHRLDPLVSLGVGKAEFLYTVGVEAVIFKFGVGFSPLDLVKAFQDFDPDPAFGRDEFLRTLEKNFVLRCMGTP